MEDKEAADEAIKNLHHHKLHGLPINVEASKSKVKISTKLHVSNIGSECTNQELRARFEEYGPVIECDIVKDYAFVHMEREEDAMEAIRGFDGTEFKGKRIHVQLSRSRLRAQPGMGDKNGCFRCGKEGHWSKECPKDRGGFLCDYPPPCPMRPMSAYGERPVYDERYEMAEHYKSYLAQPYAPMGDPYYDRWSPRLPPIGTPMSNCVPGGLDLYGKHSLPPSPPSYFNRDRSPLRRMPMAASRSGYVFDYSHANSAVMSTRSPYDGPSTAGNAYADRMQYSMF
ncbi:RNA-binding protein 4B-like isoform X2 [Narcine bancroftii]